MNELAEGPIITAERVRRVEIYQAFPAEAAETVLIQGISIHEGGTASLAEKLG